MSLHLDMLSCLPGSVWGNDDLDVLESHLDAGGMMAVLRYLNSRTAHRFTAIYKFQGPTQRAVFLHDREGRPDSRFNTMAATDSLAQFITVSRPFSVTDAATDEFLLDNGYCGVVRSYYGVALSRPGKKPAGSLCHFDLVAQAKPSPMECDFLKSAGFVLMTRLNGFGQ